MTLHFVSIRHASSLSGGYTLPKMGTVSVLQLLLLLLLYDMISDTLLTTNKKTRDLLSHS